MESQPPFSYFPFTPSVRPSVLPLPQLTQQKAATVAAAAPTSPNARPIQKSHNMKPKRRYFLKENLKPQRQPTPSLSLPPSPDIARPALLQRQKNN